MGRARIEFRKDTKYDLALLAEVESINPFAFAGKEQKAAWNDVAVKLQTCLWKMAVTGRSCKDRLKILMDDFRRDENLSNRA